MAFKKTFSYAGFEMQRKKYKNPKIALLNVELELKAEKEKKKWEGRKRNKKAIYGESSRSGFQRRREHGKEVCEGVETNQIHFSEEHNREQQEIILSIISKFQTALSRQVAKSVTIEEVAAKPEESQFKK